MNTITPPTADESTTLHERIRERAYFLWLEAGQPDGEDLVHWYAAVGHIEGHDQPVSDSKSLPSKTSSPHFSIRSTVAAHLSDPTHRFHNPALAHDDRLNVVAGEARQRVRSRSNKNPPQPKT